MGTLYLVATPIGNLEDITLRALRVLRESVLVATEDTRTTRRLLQHFDIDKPLISYYEHNKITRLEHVLKALEEGDVAVVSEAGTPVISDPGYELVKAAVERGVPVTAVPGPSALPMALSLSGLPSDRFLFVGFLPRKAGERRSAMQEMAHMRATLVMFEAPHRLWATLQDAVELWGGDRKCAVCRELTKLHEEVWRGTLAGALQEWGVREPKGEFTLVVDGAPPADKWEEGVVLEELARLMAQGWRHSDAAREIARQSGWSKSAVYALWPRQA
jgi:16S rRNA (cytidine1402-2'-O)-methyltransferase